MKAISPSWPSSHSVRSIERTGVTPLPPLIRTSRSGRSCGEVEVSLGVTEVEDLCRDAAGAEDGGRPARRDGSSRSTRAGRRIGAASSSASRSASDGRRRCRRRCEQTGLPGTRSRRHSGGASASRCAGSGGGRRPHGHGRRAPSGQDGSAPDSDRFRGGPPGGRREATSAGGEERVQRHGWRRVSGQLFTS